LAKYSSRIPDNLTKFIVVYLDESWTDKSPETLKADVMNWLEYRGNNKRTYKNCLAFVVPNHQQMDKARTNARTYGAITSLIEQKTKYNFSVEDLEELKEKQRNAQNSIKAAVERLYGEILLPIRHRESEHPITLQSIDLQAKLNTSTNLQERVLAALRNHVFASLTVDKLVSLSGITRERKYRLVNDLINSFFQYPDYPKLLNEQPIKKAILEAINQGKFAYIPHLTITSNNDPIVDNPELISINKEIINNEFDIQGYLLESEYTREVRVDYRAKKEEINPTKPVTYTEVKEDESTTVSESPKVYNEKPTGSSIERTILVDIKEGRQEAKHYRINAKLNAQQLFQLMTILQNLPDKSSQVDVRITVDAYAKTKFDLQWIRNVIEEPLDEADIQSETSLK